MRLWDRARSKIGDVPENTSEALTRRIVIRKLGTSCSRSSRLCRPSFARRNSSVDASCARSGSQWRSSTLAGFPQPKAFTSTSSWLCVTSQRWKLPGRALRSYQRLLPAVRYGAGVYERFGPSQEDYDALIAFAKANGFTVVGGSRDAMDAQFMAPLRTWKRPST